MCSHPANHSKVAPISSVIGLSARTVTIQNTLNLDELLSHPLPSNFLCGLPVGYRFSVGRCHACTGWNKKSMPICDAVARTSLLDTRMTVSGYPNGPGLPPPPPSRVGPPKPFTLLPAIPPPPTSGPASRNYCRAQ